MAETSPPPPQDAKSKYLAAMSEHGLVKAACAETGVSVGMVWEWRATDVGFDEEFQRIWLGENRRRG